MTKYCVNVTLHLATDGIDRTLFLPPRYLSCVSKIDTIIFPTYNNDGKDEIRQMNRDEAFKKILSNIRSHNNMINLFNTCKQLIRGFIQHSFKIGLEFLCDGFNRDNIQNSDIYIKYKYLYFGDDINVVG